MTNARGGCLSCGSADRRGFFAVDAVPVGSCVLLGDATTAAAYPTARIDLAVCERCGLIQNTSFDERLVDYTSGYEESQGYSLTFLAYADSLISHLDDRYDLSGALILEPGCGKGEFLVRMCETVDASGLGIDPAHVPSRIETSADVRFELDRFTAATPHTGKLVMCRHTLEHIDDVAGFLAAMRTAAERTEGAVVMVEVPDSQRVLDEGAFWDVYYEHATYFTPVSLRAAARIAGLQVLDVGSWFDDQYLVLEASVGEIEPSDPPEGEVAQILDAADRFADAVTRSIESWNERLAAAQRPVLWGASSKAVGFLAALDAPHLAGAVDINPFKQGSFLAGSGAEILAPDRLIEVAPDLVVVMNPIYTDEIAASIAEMGLAPEVVAC